MKKLAALLLSALFLLPLTACRTKETASRAETVQERYAALTSYTAAAAVELADEEENVRYTLRFDADAEETKVTVLAPELLAGVTAHLAADTLKLEYDGLVLDAGGTPGGVSAVTCVPLALRAQEGIPAQPQLRRSAFAVFSAPSRRTSSAAACSCVAASSAA